MPDRPLLVHIPSLGKDLLFPVSFECHEELSAPFRIQLHLVGALDTEIPFEKLLGCPLGVELQHGGVTRFFHGVVEEFSEGERDQRQVHYFATVVPRLSLLRLRVRSRIFQWQNVKDILETVLADLNPDLRQLGNYPARQYCVQYQESDFAFASRLMEEEGIYYFFEHEQNDHRLVLVDAKTSNRNLPEQARVRFDRTASAGSHELVVSSWRKTQRVVCPKRVVRDYTFLKAEKPLEGARPIVDQVACGQAQHQLKAANTQTLEACDFPEFAKYFDTIDLGGGENKTGDFSGIYQAKDDRAELRAEEEASRALHIAGSGNCPHFLPGYLFSLQGHPHADDSYLLTSVIHRGTDQARVTSEAAASFQYTCKFECLPGSLQYRPARHTPSPCVRGLQTALVVTGGSEVSIDKHARVKVKFHWDLSETSELNSSSRIRVGQFW
ncbi:MAG: type VI secretion system Vgr family protein, partial [Gemmataceae bacterium]